MNLLFFSNHLRKTRERMAWQIKGLRGNVKPNCAESFARMKDALSNASVFKRL